jgi:hypothetical protein
LNRSVRLWRGKCCRPWPGLELIGWTGPLIGAVLGLLVRGALIGIGVAVAVGILLTRRA